MLPLLIASVMLNANVINAISDFDTSTNSTLYSFHFLGINGIDNASTVGYVQSYNGVEYYAYNGNSLCVLTATNSSGSISKFTVSDDFGKCPDYASGTLTELTSHANGYFVNSNNNDQWHFTWFDIDSSPEIGSFGTSRPSVSSLDTFNNQRWHKYKDCDLDDGTIRDMAQSWGPMSYFLYKNDSVLTTTEPSNFACYFVKADPLSSGTPTATYNEA